jgi:hypothetical protein
MPTTLQDETSLALKKAKLDRRVNDASLGSSIGLSRHYVNQMINHPAHYRHREAFRRLCKALGVTPAH